MSITNKDLSILCWGPFDALRLTKILAVRNFFSTSHLHFSPADLIRSVYFHLLFHCHYFSYLVLVFAFKFNCSLGNRYF